MKTLYFNNAVTNYDHADKDFFVVFAADIVVLYSFNFVYLIDNKADKYLVVSL